MFSLVLLFTWFAIFKKFVKKNKKKPKKTKNSAILLNKKNAIIVVLILLVFIGLVEVFLRYKYRNYESTSYYYTIDNFHPFLQSKLSATEPLHINQFGFRAEEIQMKKPKDVYRIFVLGGSTVLNREVVYKKNSVYLLEQKLKKQYPEKKIEVINAGKDYYTSEHSVIQYMFYIKEFSPDMIIMWHGINDLYESCSVDGVTHGQYKSDYSHFFGAVSNIVNNYFRPQPIIQIKLLTFDFFVKFLHDNFYSDLTNIYKEYQKVTSAKNYRSGINTISDYYFPSVEAYKRNLLYLISILKEENVELVLGDQPSLYKNNPTLNETEKIMFPQLICKKDNKYLSIDSFKKGLDIFNNITKQVALENSVPFIDLDKKVPKNLNYFVDSVHYTERGNEAIADSLFDYIVRNNLIK